MPSDYISRSELLRKLTVSEDGKRYPMVDCDNFPVQYPICDLIKVIREQSAAPVESVVHCSECKFWEYEKCCVNAPFGCPEREKSDFCSRGERKDGDSDA